MTCKRTLILLAAAAMPWFAVFSKVVVFYVLLGFAAMSAPVPVLGDFIFGALVVAVIPLAAELLVISPLITIWLIVQQRRTPIFIVRIHQVNMVIIAMFCLGYCIVALVISANHLDSDRTHAAGMLGNAIVLAAGAICSALSVRNLNRLCRDRPARDLDDSRDMLSANARETARSE